MWIIVTKPFDYDQRSPTGALQRTFAFVPRQEPVSTIREAGEAAVAAGCAERAENPRSEPETVVTEPEPRRARRG